LTHKASHNCLRLNQLQQQMMQSLQEEELGERSIAALHREATPEQLQLVQELEKHQHTAQQRLSLLAQVGRLEGLLASNLREVEAVLHSVSLVEARQFHSVLRGVEDNTSALHTSCWAAQMTSRSLHVLQALALITLVFTLIDRIGAGSLNVPAPTWVITLIKEPLMDPPLVWFMVNIILAAVVYVVFEAVQQRRLRRARQTLAAQVQCGCSLESVEELQQYLQRRQPYLLYQTNSDASSALVTVRYKEPTTTDLWKWGGAPPEVQLTFDQKLGLLSHISLWVDRSLNSSAESALMRTLLSSLVRCGALSSLQMQGVMTTYQHESRDHDNTRPRPTSAASSRVGTHGGGATASLDLRIPTSLPEHESNATGNVLRLHTPQ